MVKYLTESSHGGTPTRRTGRNRPVAHGPRLRLARYRAALPTTAPLPASVDYSAKAMPSLSRCYMNDQIGDCVLAARAHLVGVFTGNADGTPAVVEDADVLSDYSRLTGYDPNDPSTDRGTDEQLALHDWVENGIGAAGAHKVAGYVVVDASNVDEVKFALDEFENLFFGIELDDSWIDVAPGGVWDSGTPQPVNGHCVVGVGYDERGVQVATWGFVVTLTWDALRRFVGLPSSGGELYSVISPEVVSRVTQRAPTGLDWARLTADFRAIGGNV